MTGTGRCGTKTWARACGHLTNYTSGHETNRGRFDESFLSFPNFHVEVDPHLSWALSMLRGTYPSEMFVHLWRPEDEVVESWRRRGIRRHTGAAPLVDVIFQVRSVDLSSDEYDVALRTLYRMITSRCEEFVRSCGGMSVNIHEAQGSWDEFCERICATGDIDSGRIELGRRA